MRLSVVSCDGCGACCTDQQVPPDYMGLLLRPDDHLPEDSDDLARLAALPEAARSVLVARINEIIECDGDVEGACVWFDAA